MGEAIDAGAGDSVCMEPLGATDITLRVLGDLMNETMALMDETVALGDRRNAGGEASPHEVAVGLRLAARLARVGGWLMAHSPGDSRLDQDDDAKAARLTASMELQAAARGRLDGADRHGPIRQLSARIDRLVLRACRLDAQLNPREPSASGSARPMRPGASVIAFPGARRAQRSDA